MKRTLAFVGIGLVAALAAATYVVLDKGGTFRTIEGHFAGRCTAIGGVVGAEDIVIDHQAKRAWISSDNRRAWAAGGPVRGMLYAYDLGSASAQPIDATPPAPLDFHPHGMSLWTAPDGAQTLFVINHQGFGGHRVEVFTVAADKLSYMGGVVLAELRSPNAIVAVGDRQFYVTNDHGSGSTFGRWLERTFALADANVVYFDGQGARVVAAGLRFPSGIEVSADGSRIFVGEATGKALKTYARDVQAGNLSLLATTPLDTAPDNLRRDDVGNIWVAAHPKLLALVRHFGSAEALSPSQVLRLSTEGEGFTAEEVLLDPGDTLSAASVAAVSGKRLLIGPIMDPRMLDCTLP